LAKSSSSRRPAGPHPEQGATVMLP
jgi:hypothetical protein